MKRSIFLTRSTIWSLTPILFHFATHTYIDTYSLAHTFTHTLVLIHPFVLVSSSIETRTARRFDTVFFHTVRHFLLHNSSSFPSPPLFYNKYVHTLNICTSLKIFSFSLLLLVYSSLPLLLLTIFIIDNLKRDILSSIFFYPITFFSFSCVTI